MEESLVLIRDCCRESNEWYPEANLVPQYWADLGEHGCSTKYGLHNTVRKWQGVHYPIRLSCLLSLKQHSQICRGQDEPSHRNADVRCSVAGLACTTWFWCWYSSTPIIRTPVIWLPWLPEQCWCRVLWEKGHILYSYRTWNSVHMNHGAWNENACVFPAHTFKL